METREHTLNIASIPRQLWLGLLLIVVFWPLNWLLPGLRTHLFFFPLWLGYILTVDGLVLIRRRTSLLQRNWRAFIGLFVVSAPAWWLFEVLNWRTGNWVYLGRAEFSNLSYALLASLSFSTVIPAVFETAELASSFRWLQRIGRGLPLRPTRTVLLTFFVTGWLMVVLLWLWPGYFFPFLWLSVYFILAPVNVWLGYRSLARYTAMGDWRPAIALMLGALICGFFWEMWNYYAFPKWEYQVPFVDFWHLFEMPLLGYTGYLPFSLELFALYHLVVGVLGLPLNDYVQVAGTEKYQQP